MKPLFLILTLLLTACSNLKFSESDLAPAMYKGYWAMLPIDNIYRVIKFHSNGMVKIYEYQCNKEEYRLTETETHYLSKEKNNVFMILDDKKKAFARFEITRTSPQQFQARQQFIDSKIEPRILHLSYKNQVGAKPICVSL